MKVGEKQLIGKFFLDSGNYSGEESFLTCSAIFHSRQVNFR